jgi:hypothetical protein
LGLRLAAWGDLRLIDPLDAGPPFPRPAPGRPFCALAGRFAVRAGPRGSGGRRCAPGLCGPRVATGCHATPAHERRGDRSKEPA